MGICSCCGRDMRKAKGCIPSPIPIKGKGFMNPIKMGSLMDKGNMSGAKRCGDCAAQVGGYHHPGCDLEICPACGSTILSCDCVYCIDVTMSDTDLRDNLAVAREKLGKVSSSSWEYFNISSDISDMEQLIEDRKNGLFLPEGGK